MWNVFEKQKKDAHSRSKRKHQNGYGLLDRHCRIPHGIRRRNHLTASSEMSFLKEKYSILFLKRRYLWKGGGENITLVDYIVLWDIYQSYLSQHPGEKVTSSRHRVRVAPLTPILPSGRVNPHLRKFLVERLKAPKLAPSLQVFIIWILYFEPQEEKFAFGCTRYHTYPQRAHRVFNSSQGLVNIYRVSCIYHKSLH